MFNVNRCINSALSFDDDDDDNVTLEIILHIGISDFYHSSVQNVQKFK